MALLVRIVSVRTGREVSRVALDDAGVISYSGGDTAQTTVARVMSEFDLSEADAIGALSRDGWSNGYLMVALDQP
jgi:hypothetical protein